MKKCLVVFPLLVLLLTQCRQTDDAAPILTQAQAFTLAAGDTARVLLMNLATSFKSTADFLTFKLAAINDSRCPANADCIRAGEATTTFTLSAYGAPSSEQTLSIPAPDAKNRTDSTTVRVGNSLFVVVLKSVQPFPGTGSGTKTATFVVK